MKCSKRSVKRNENRKKRKLETFQTQSSVNLLSFTRTLWGCNTAWLIGLCRHSSPLQRSHMRERQLTDMFARSFPSNALFIWQGDNLVCYLTLYTIASVCIFSILFPLHFLKCWKGEFVSQARASAVMVIISFILEILTFYSGVKIF